MANRPANSPEHRPAHRLPRRHLAFRKDEPREHHARSHCPVSKRSHQDVYGPRRRRRRVSGARRGPRDVRARTIRSSSTARRSRRRRRSARTIPPNPAEVVGSTSSASKEQALEAIDAAARAFESWKRVAVNERAAFIFKAAELLRQRRFEYDALLVYGGRQELARGRRRHRRSDRLPGVLRARSAAIRRSRSRSFRSPASRTRWSTSRSASAP